LWKRSKYDTRGTGPASFEVVAAYSVFRTPSANLNRKREDWLEMVEDRRPKWRRTGYRAAHLDTGVATRGPGTGSSVFMLCGGTATQHCLPNTLLRRGWRL
jgi:hypothetical protein